MNKLHVDYDTLASTYNQRFKEGQRQDTAVALIGLAQSLSARQVLEVGCGTGHWLAELADVVPRLYGLDFSRGMLAQAGARPLPLQLVQGKAGELPAADNSFDLVYCVNAIHHFSAPQAFIRHAYRLLRPGGALAVIGMAPHGRREHWYVYDFFDGTYETDLDRFPRWENIEQWMHLAGLRQISRRLVERIVENKRGAEVLKDPFLQKHATSQLALLSDEAYATGMRRIRAHLHQAEQTGQTPIFTSEIELEMVSGYKPRDGHNQNETG